MGTAAAVDLAVVHVRRSVHKLNQRLEDVVGT